MGRGETQDRFSQILGTRRGSASAQKGRDREEALAAIATHLPYDGALDPKCFGPLAPFLELHDTEIEAGVTAAISDNLHRNGLATAAAVLRAPRREVSAAAQSLVRTACAEYIASVRQVDASAKREHLTSFVEDLFTTTPLRSLPRVKADLPIIEAIAKTYEDEWQGKNDTRAWLFRFLAVSASTQPESHLSLSLFTSWREALVRATKHGNYSPIAMRDFSESMSKYTPEARVFFAPLAEALEERFPLQPQS